MKGAKFEDKMSFTWFILQEDEIKITLKYLNVQLEGIG